MSRGSPADRSPEFPRIKDQIIRRLGEAYADNLLLLEDYERRVIAARSATRREELDTLIDDLADRSHHARGRTDSRAQQDVAETLSADDAANLRVFKHILSLDPSNIQALRGAASVLRGNDSPLWTDHEIRYLTRLDDLTDLSETELARFGNLRYRLRDHFGAIESWGRAVPKSHRPAYLYFSQGLAYSQKSQDADAVDMWRRALNIDPTYEPAKRELKRTAPRLLTLADDARRSGDTVVDRKRWYASYLSPLELLDLGDDADLSDERLIRKRRKAVLHEIELEDGHLSWLPGITIERSRALTVLGELDDARLRRHHALVYADKRLLAFLSRGAHRHFLVDAENLLAIYKPENLNVLDNIARNQEFRVWLSGYFARQYDQVLAIAIERKNLPMIECLMSGRRWVLPSQEDDCFPRPRRVVDCLIEPLSDARKAAAAQKPTFVAIERLLERINVDSILNLLPTFFELQQTAAVGELRQLAIECYNTHRDSALSRQILELTQRFRFKSSELGHQLDRDFEQIENLVEEERKHEFRMKRGKVTWEITKTGIRSGSGYIGMGDVVSVRFSAHATSGSFVRTMHYLFVFRGEKGKRVSFRWKDHAWMHRDMLNACFSYVVPQLVERVDRRIRRHEIVRIGPFGVTEHGVSFKTGVLLRRWQHVAWSDADVRIGHGMLFVADRRRSKVANSCSVDDTENVIVLSALAERRAQGQGVK